MQVRVKGLGTAGYGPGGPEAGIIGWGDGHLVDIDDNDDYAVAWAERAVASGHAELVDEPPPPAPKKSAAKKET